jgi:hypothetical protein
MKKIKLSDGRSVQIGTQFGNERPKLERPLPPGIADKPFRSVRLRLTVFDAEDKQIGELTGVSHCNPGDQFDRIEGRRKATKRLIEANHKRNEDGARQREAELLTREDCRVLFPVLLLGRIEEPEAEEVT